MTTLEPPKVRLRLDPWPGDYQPAIQFDAQPEPAVHIDSAVETSAWGPLPPPAAGPDRDLCFVDGVRRVEARLLADSPPGLVHGLCGSIGVGCARASGGRLAFERIEISRFLILGSGLERELRIQAGDLGLDFRKVSAAGNSPSEVLAALQNLMRAQEASLAERLASPAACLLVDGPLTYLSPVVREIVGIVKTLYQPYLAAADFALLPALPPGCRTPLFLIQGGGNDRYSWFLRLAGPGPADHPLAGLIRLEVAAAAGLETAKRHFSR